MKIPQRTSHSVAGCAVSGFRKGTGEPLVYLHGAGGGEWFPFLDKLAEQFEVFAYDHPGFGMSDDPVWLNDIGDLAYFYLDLLKDLGIGKAHIVGSSLGGWIALEMAVRSTAQIRTLALSAPAGIHVKGVSKADVFIEPPEKVVYSLVSDRSLADSMSKRIASLNEDEQAIAYKGRTTAAKLCWQPYLYNPGLKNWLFRIRVPTCLIWGAEDRIIPFAHAAAFEKLLPDCNVTRVEECGHMPHVEKEEEFVATVVNFIEGADK